MRLVCFAFQAEAEAWCVGGPKGSPRVSDALEIFGDLESCVFGHSGALHRPGMAAFEVGDTDVAAPASFETCGWIVVGDRRPGRHA